MTTRTPIAAADHASESRPAYAPTKASFTAAPTSPNAPSGVDTARRRGGLLSWLQRFAADVSDFIAGDVCGEIVAGRHHDLCRTIHVEGACPRQLIGVCDVCGPVDLTCDQENYGGCPNSGPHGGLVHYVQQRRAKPRRTPLREVKAID